MVLPFLKVKRLKAIRWTQIGLILIVVVLVFLFSQKLILEPSQEEGGGFLNGVSFGLINLPPEKTDSTISLSPSFSSLSLSDETGDLEYVSSQYLFGFRYPKDFTITTFPDRGGDIVLARNSKGVSAFQIFITPYDEPTGSLNIERLRRDLPDLVIEQPQVFVIDNLASGLSFVSSSSSGLSREVWFVYRGYLYQITAMVDDELILQTMLRTWYFN